MFRIQRTDNYAFRVVGNQIHFGTDDNSPPGRNFEPFCMKNLSNEKCTFSFVKNLVEGQSLTSAADFGTLFEFGLANEINLGFYPRMLHVVLTADP